jgi:hypothetical protein
VEGRKPVAKVVIFMHMYNFSLFNCPPFKVRATPLRAHRARDSATVCVLWPTHRYSVVMLCVCVLLGASLLCG